MTERPHVHRCPCSVWKDTWLVALVSYQGRQMLYDIGHQTVLWYNFYWRQLMMFLLRSVQLKAGMRNEMCWHFGYGSIADFVGMPHFMSLPLPEHDLILFTFILYSGNPTKEDDFTLFRKSYKRRWFSWSNKSSQTYLVWQPMDTREATGQVKIVADENPT